MTDQPQYQVKQMQSESVKEVLKAMLAARQDYNSLTKNAQNPHLKNNYADLNAIKQVIDRPLAENGIIVMDQVYSQGEWVTITTRAIHVESGEWIGSEFGGQASGKNIAQSIGSLQTYGRRYNRLGLFDLNAVDDDGESGPQRLHPLEQDAGNGKTLGERVQGAIKAMETKPTKENAKAALQIQHRLYSAKEQVKDGRTIELFNKLASLTLPYTEGQAA